MMSRRIALRSSATALAAAALALGAMMLGAPAPAAGPLFVVEPESAALCRKMLLMTAEPAWQKEQMVIAGREGWLFLTSELRHLGVGPFWGDKAAAVSRAPEADMADPLPAILDFHAQLQRQGIELLVLPVPAKTMVYREHVPGLKPPQGREQPAVSETQLQARDRVGLIDRPEDRAFPRFDDPHQQFYLDLLAKGVHVWDLTDTFRALAVKEQMHCKTDSHWSPRGCQAASAAIVRRLQEPGRAWLKEVAKGKFTAEERTIEIQGDLTRMPNAPKAAAEKLPARYIKDAATGEPPEIDKTSPVLLMGDSHTLVFQAGGDDLHGRACGLADQLAHDLGFRIDLIGTRGSGATPVRLTLARRARSDPAYLQGKKLVVWCFAVREFTESQGWQKVQLLKPAAP